MLAWTLTFKKTSSRIEAKYAKTHYINSFDTSFGHRTEWGEPEPFTHSHTSGPECPIPRWLISLLLSLDRETNKLQSDPESLLDFKYVSSPHQSGVRMKKHTCVRIRSSRNRFPQSNVLVLKLICACCFSRDVTVILLQLSDRKWWHLHWEEDEFRHNCTRLASLGHLIRIWRPKWPEHLTNSRCWPLPPNLSLHQVKLVLSHFTLFYLFHHFAAELFFHG